MTHFQPIGTLSDRRLSWVDNMMDLIERHAPLMMKVGGGAVAGATHECLTRGRAMPAETRELILAMNEAGKPLEEISAHTGFHYGTICRITRPFRPITRGPRLHP